MTTSTSLGQRIALARKRRHMTQEQLADESSIYLGIIRKLEQGKKAGARLETITALAQALDVPIQELLGVHPGLSTAGHRADVSTVRSAIYNLSDDHEPTDPGVLRGQLADLRVLYWQARYTLLAEQIPATLAAARSGVRAAFGDEQRRQAQATLAETLKLTASLVTHLSYEDLAHVALLQARDAADASEDHLLIAAQRSTTAWVLSRQGLWEQAQVLASNAAREIEPVFSRASPDQIAMWGQLLHFGMVALAREGRGDEAHELLGLVQAAGQAVGDRTGDPTHPQLFSGTFAAHSAVQLHQATDQPGKALKAADRVERPDYLPPSIHARFLLNKAWAQTLEFRSQEALDTLRQVEAMTPELMNHHGLARQIVEELMPRRKKQKIPGLRALAERMGVTG